ncbi:MAG: DNA recombination protein RmuC [Clostridiales bacterium]|nr:DNA recombination protein RmuC [Clostridiales bacterium]
MVEWWIVVLCSALGLVLGIGVMYGVFSSRLSSARSDAATAKQLADVLRQQAEGEKSISSRLNSEKLTLLEENSSLKTQLSAQKQWMDTAEIRMKESFKALSDDVMRVNSTAFLNTANDKFKTLLEQMNKDMVSNSEKMGSIVNPLGENLTKLEKEIKELEAKRQQAYGSLTEQVKGLSEQSVRLTEATNNINNVLHSGKSRGKWGEEQLKRIAEMSGMVEHIDFNTQVTQSGAESTKRPDMVIHLSGGRDVPVDSKVPMDEYMRYSVEDDAQRRSEYLTGHIRSLKKHINELSGKEYWKQLDGPVDFVVMFIPYESGLSAAFEGDSDIFQYASDKNVLLLSPVTFYAFLKAVSSGWTEVRMTENIKKISQASNEIIERFTKFITHVENIGKGLNAAVKGYNQAMSSYNSRLLPSFRRMEELSEQSKLDTEEKEQILFTNDMAEAVLIEGTTEDERLPGNNE